MTTATMLQNVDQANVVFRELYGSEPQVLAEQKKRYQTLIRAFKTAFGDTQAMLFSSPGRTEIGGNHTDHNHGRVLAGAVNLDNIAIASCNDLYKVRIRSSGYQPLEVDLNLLDPDPSEKYSSASLVRGILARLKELGYHIGGFDACIEGRVPKGSGISSSASFEVLIGVIVSHLYNDGRLGAVENARIGQYAENVYFMKPCGLMDQTACAVGGLVTIDFKNPADPVVKKIHFDFTKTGYALVITDTKGDHSNLNEEYAALPAEMKSVAQLMGQEVQRQITLEQLLRELPSIRKQTGDRAILRAIHFQGDNLRVFDQVQALEQNDFKGFLRLVIASGYSSYMYNQNIYSASNIREQGVALGLALSELVLKGHGAWRVHGGGFAGTIQAFVPQELLRDYTDTLEHVFGPGACHKMFIRNQGAIRVVLGE